MSEQFYQAELTKGQKDMGMLVHASGFAGYLIPFGNILGPLIVWLMKRDEMPFVDSCGRNCINFKLSMMIYFCVSFILMFVGIGFLLLGILAVVDIIFTVIAIIKASDGISYEYPLTIKFLK